MGAEFIYAICRVPTPDQAENALARIDELDDDMLESIGQNLWAATSTMSDLSDIRDALKTALQIVTEANRRDIGVFTDLSGQDWVLSGGMTWGETPTAACEYLWALAQSGILDITEQES